MKTSFFSQSQTDFETWWKSTGSNLGPHRRIQSSLVSGEFNEVPNFHPEVSDSLLEKLNRDFSFELPKPVEIRECADKTLKYLFQFKDGLQAESVAIPFHKKYTLCLSSQVGCAMGCTFCFTGTQGLSRNLESHEIVGQYLAVWRDLKKRKGHPKTPNIVFMGQGEPLHNFEELKKAINYLINTPGVSLGPRQMTLSTVGHLPGLKRFEELPPINLAISLHSPFEEERAKLIPINKAYPIKDLFDVLDQMSWGRRKLINFEYLLLGDLNDDREHAKALAKLISRYPSLVNLIPFNPYPGSPYKRPTEAQVEQFKEWLVEEKVRTMVRVTKGDEILAACGQLANLFTP